jgi:serine/threonine-protein kinase
MTTGDPGSLIGGRYRLERLLSQTQGPQGSLWLGTDSLAAEAPVVLRRVGAERDQERVRQLWTRLQGVLHPQVPRFGAAIEEEGALWLVREWQGGRTYGQLLAARRDRQLVFGAGEVLLLLRQLLPVLVVLHGQELIHGDLTPANLLRRDRDGQPVLLDFGLLRGLAEAADPGGATPGYAPPEQLAGGAPQTWMDLYSLGVVAMVLLSGDDPEALLDPVSLEWRWPAALETEPALASQISRLVSLDPRRRYASAAQALAAFQALAMPDSTGPVPRADRTLVLVPPPVDHSRPPVEPAQPLAWTEADPVEAPAAAPDPAVALASPPPQAPLKEQLPPGAGAGPGYGYGAGLGAGPGSDAGAGAGAVEAPLDDPWSEPAALESSPQDQRELRKRRRQEDRETAAEGGLWPVLIALVLSVLAGTALGWWWLGRGKPQAPAALAPTDEPSGGASLPPTEVDQRQQLLSRLRAMQVDRGWFLSLVDANLLAQYPERRGRLPTDSLEDAPLRRVWNQLAEDWLARVEQLPMALRRRLGSFSAGDWKRRQESFLAQGLSTEVLQQLVSGSTQSLLPGRNGQDMPAEPFRQLWYAAADQTLESVRIEPIEVPPQVTQLLSADVPASGARLFPIRLPTDHALVLGVNGSPLLQMSVYGADGTLIAPKGPLRVLSLGQQVRLPVQLLVTNEGVAPARISLSLRADPPAPAPPTAGDTPPPPEEVEAPDTPAPGAAAEPTGPSAAPGGDSPVPPPQAPSVSPPPPTQPQPAPGQGGVLSAPVAPATPAAPPPAPARP